MKVSLYLQPPSTEDGGATGMIKLRRLERMQLLSGNWTTGRDVPASVETP